MWRRLSTFAVIACAPIFAAGEALAPSLQATLEKLSAEQGACVVAVVVAVATVKNRTVASEGVANGCAATPLTSAQAPVFQAASLSKPVFAYAVLKLAQQGKLDLNAPVINYLPQQEVQGDLRGYVHVQNPFSAGKAFTDLVTATELKEVTASTLLTHSSGLPNWANHALSFSFKPGARWQYSGEGYVMLQRAVEAIEGQPLNEVMQRLVFEPLGMTNSSYVWTDRFKDSLVPGTDRSGVAMRVVRFQKPVAAATLYSTAPDYAKFLAAMLRDEALLNTALEKTVSVDKRLGLAWGLGWGVAFDPSAASFEAERLIWQWGNNPGYRAFVMASVKTGDGVVVLTNSDKGMAMVEPIVNSVLPGKHDVFKFHMLR
jgi:CubicO group peptidase (beta-lactamase class C family)